MAKNLFVSSNIEVTLSLKDHYILTQKWSKLGHLSWLLKIID